MNNQLVTLYGNEVFTDSMVIANGTGNQHESVVRLIKEQHERLKKFGEIYFSDLKSGKRGRPSRVYKLNEPQATLLVTFLDNTEVVADFKTELVRQFYSMRQFIFERQSDGWRKVREQGKITRKAETDTLSGLVEYARKQGYDHEDKFLYMNYTKLANKICGISKRDNANMEQLSNLTVAENIILHCIQIGIGQEKHYKDIYQDCKKRLEMFKDIAYLEVA
jgi:phage regulator Rha-like protein